MLESLVKCGAFDFLGRERAELFACIDESLAAASAIAQGPGQRAGLALRRYAAAGARSRALKRVLPWTEHEKMSYEKELLGFYVTGHPLDAYATLLAEGNIKRSRR